jgi:hypothetical protein
VLAPSESEAEPALAVARTAKPPDPQRRAHIHFVRLLKRTQQLAYADTRPLALPLPPAAPGTTTPNTARANELDTKHSSSAVTLTSPSGSVGATGASAAAAPPAGSPVAVAVAALSDDQRTKFFQYLSALNQQLEALKPSLG